MARWCIALDSNAVSLFVNTETAMQIVNSIAFSLFVNRETAMLSTYHLLSFLGLWPSTIMLSNKASQSEEMILGKDPQLQILLGVHCYF